MDQQSPRVTETFQAFQATEAPHGCFVTKFLSTDEYVQALIDPSREAPYPVAAEPPRTASGKRNTVLYNAHSYHTKIPPEAIVPFLRHFTRPGDVVLDPFCGSGMTGVAALVTGRRAILGDLSVAAVHLAYNHTRPCDPRKLVAAFENIARNVFDEFKDLYSCFDGSERGYVYYTLWGRDAICPTCSRSFSVWGAIDRRTGRMPVRLRCPHCNQVSAKQSLRYAESRPVLISYEDHAGHRLEKEPTNHDLQVIGRFSRDSIPDWYPQVPVDSSREMFIRSALHLQGIKTVADFYTPRNLQALAKLWRCIQGVEDERVRAALAFAFTNTAWHGTRMRRFNARGGQRPLTGTLYIPQLSSEANVLEVMRNKIRQLRSYYETLNQHQGVAPAIRLGSATRLDGIPDGSIDYVFTDPPFGSNIFYADCNLIWESWLGGVTRDEEEAVVNRSRDIGQGGKTVREYQRLMTASLLEMHRVLKPGAWATLVFHNTDPDVWRALQASAEQAGFRVEDAGTLDRKQQSHKGYKGRAGQEDVAHFDVIMSMRKRGTVHRRKRKRIEEDDLQRIISDAFHGLPPSERSVQRVHSEVMRRLARAGLDLGAVSFELVREFTVREPATKVQQELFE